MASIRTAGLTKDFGELRAVNQIDLDLYLSNANRADLEVLKALVEAEQLMAVIDSSFALEETPTALRHIEAGHALGKVVTAV